MSKPPKRPPTRTGRGRRQTQVTNMAENQPIPLRCETCKWAHPETCAACRADQRTSPRGPKFQEGVKK